MTKVIHPPGSWDQWSKSLLQEFERSKTNQKVGECVVLENHLFRVWHIHLLPHQKIPLHIHTKPYFWTALTAGKGRSYLGDGSIVETEYEVGSSKFFQDLSEDYHFIHNLENIGNSVWRIQPISATLALKK